VIACVEDVTFQQRLEHARGGLITVASHDKYNSAHAPRTRFT